MPLRPKPEPLAVTVPSQFMIDGGRPLPDADKLSPPFAIEPQVFRAEDIDQRVLGLALACNDLRDALWVARQCDLGRGKAQREPNGYDGDVMGRALWAVRIAAATMHETLNAIRVLKRECALDPMWARTTARMNMSEHRQWWDDALALAEEPVPDRGRRPPTAGPRYDDREYLDAVRNKLAYHYIAPRKLWEGYEGAFLTRTTENRHTDWAYMSMAEKLSQQRYFFADAAIQVAHAGLSGDPQRPYARMNELAEAVAKGANIFIVAFVAVREADLSASAA